MSGSADQSLRFRFEAFSKFASEIGEARDLQGIHAALQTNVKYIIEAFCFQVFSKGPGHQVCFASFLGQDQITENAEDPVFHLAEALYTKVRPMSWDPESLQSSALFEESFFAHPRVRHVIGLSMDFGLAEKALILAGNKNEGPHHQLDYKFCRLILRTLASKMEQFFTSRDLIISLERQEQLMADLNLAKSFAENILRSMGDGLVITDAGGKIIDLNPALLDLLGYQREQLLGQSAGLLFAQGDPGQMPWTDEEWKRLQIKGSVRGREKNLRQITGKHVPVFFSGGAIYDRNQQLNGVVCVLHDITERKQRESDRRKLDLAQAVAETEKKRADELKKLNEELDRFVYATSHELRAPMLSVLGLIDLVQLSADDAETRQNLLERMKESVGKLDTLINNITDFSRNSRAEIEVEAVDFSEMLDEVFGSMKVMPQFERIRLQLELKSDVPIYTDRSRLKIILNNLLSNAVKFHDMDRESPHIEVKLQADAGQIHFTIQDNGPGIAEEHHAKVFNMFYRASYHSDGAGIGLYIVKETVEKLQGNLGFESDPGVGTRFQIHLPNLSPPTNF